jgi:hypothetical protein
LKERSNGKGKLAEASEEGQGPCRAVEPTMMMMKGPSVPIGQEAGCASELVWTQRLEENFFNAAGDGTPLVQSVVRYSTD